MSTVMFAGLLFAGAWFGSQRGGISADWLPSDFGVFGEIVLPEGGHRQKAGQEAMMPENSAVAFLSRARSLVNHWRREHGPDEGIFEIVSHTILEATAPKKRILNMK